MTTIYREFDCNTRQLKILNPTVTGGVRGDDNSLKIVFIYTNDTYLEDKKPYIVFDVVNPDTNNLYTFSEDTTPKFDGYVFTVPAELLQQKGIANGYIHFQLGFIGLADQIGDVVFSQSQIDYLEFTAANTLITRDSLSSDLSQAPTYYAWAEYYKEHGLLDSIEQEETASGCIVRFTTYSGEVIEVPFTYVKLTATGEIPDTIFPKITVIETVKSQANYNHNDFTVEDRDTLLGLTAGKYHGVRKLTGSDGVETLLYFITSPTTDGTASITKYYRKVVVPKDTGVNGETEDKWYVSDSNGEIVKAEITEGDQATLVNVEADDLFQTDLDKFAEAEEELTDGSGKVYGYYAVSYGGKTTPVYYVISSTGIKYYTYETQLNEDGTAGEKVWYLCNENGTIMTHDVITETTEIAFEEKENKINQWAEYNTSTNIQYPTAKLVWDSLKEVGRVDPELVPYTMVNGVAATGTHPVEGGAVYDAIENERTNRIQNDKILTKSVSDLDTAITNLSNRLTSIDGIHTDKNTAQDTEDERQSGLITTLQGQVTSLTESVAAAAQSATATKNYTTEQIGALETRIDTKIKTYITDDDSVVKEALQNTVESLNNTMTATSNSLYQSMNLLKNEVAGTVTSSITVLKNDVATLQTTTSTHTRELAAVNENITTLSEAMKGVSDNLSIDFTKYDLVTVDKDSGKIADELLPDSAITEFFGPVTSQAALTTVQRRKVVAHERKIPVMVSETAEREVKTTETQNKYALFDCEPYDFEIGNAEYHITKEIYTLDQSGNASIKYRLCPQYGGSAYTFYDGTTANGTAVPRYYASALYSATPAYTIFRGTSSEAIYSVTTTALSNTQVYVSLKNPDTVLNGEDNSATLVVEFQNQSGSEKTYTLHGTDALSFTDVTVSLENADPKSVTVTGTFDPSVANAGGQYTFVIKDADGKDVQTIVVPTQYVIVEGSVPDRENHVFTPIEIATGTYNYTVLDYATGEVKYSGVPDKAKGNIIDDQVILTKLGTSTSKYSITKFFESIVTTTTESYETGNTVAKLDEFGNVVYEQTQNIRRMELSAVSSILFLSTGVISDKNRTSDIFTVIEDDSTIYLSPLTASDYTPEMGTLVGSGKRFTLSGGKSVTFPYTSTLVGTATYNLVRFYVVTQQDNGEWKIDSVDKTVTTYQEEYVYPQRGDICMVRGATVNNEDGTYLLGRSDADGHTYSSVLAHWVKLYVPEAHWGKITGDPSPVEGEAGNITDQADLMAEFAKKEDKFTVGNGLVVSEDEADGRIVGHATTLGNTLSRGVRDGTLNMLTITSDAYGHIKSMNEHIVYPPTEIGKYFDYSSENKTGSDYWGVSQDTQGKNVCQWVTPSTEVVANSVSLVTSSGIHKAINEAKSDMGQKITSVDRAKQNTLSLVTVSLTSGYDWTSFDGGVYSQIADAAGATSAAKYMISFDAKYRQASIDYGIDLVGCTSTGKLRFTATTQPTETILVNVLIIP